MTCMLPTHAAPLCKSSDRVEFDMFHYFQDANLPDITAFFDPAELVSLFDSRSCSGVRAYGYGA